VGWELLDVVEVPVLGVVGADGDDLVVSLALFIFSQKHSVRIWYLLN
jgi:hypothetical protein